MDQTREKQVYLKTEILLKGYDPNSFAEYLSTKREDGDDIETWTLDELKTIVLEFQSMSKPEIKETLPTQIEKEDTQTEDDKFLSSATLPQTLIVETKEPKQEEKPAPIISANTNQTSDLEAKTKELLEKAEIDLKSSIDYSIVTKCIQTSQNEFSTKKNLKVILTK